MENNKQNNIDKLFHETAKKTEETKSFPAFEKVWDKVEKKLDEEPKKKSRIFPVWLPYGIAAGLALTLGSLYLFNKNEKPKSAVTIVKTNEPKPEIPQNSSSFNNDEIEELDDQIKTNIEKNPVEKEKEIIAYHDAEKENPKIHRVEFGNADISVSSAPQKMEIVSGDYEAPAPPPTVLAKATSMEKTKDIEGVVVTAMGIKREPKKINFTSTSVSEALSGKVAGLNIVNKGNPGSSPNVVIRGIASLKEKKNNIYSGKGKYLETADKDGIPGFYDNLNQPLYIIDGIPTNDRIFIEKINPDDIKKMSVLKDAAATSLYGARASNGAVIIELKQAKKSHYKELKKQMELLPKPDNNESYDFWQENPFELVKSQPLSTFSIDVDNAAYSNIRRMINNGQMVDKNAVRIEEMINYFKYSYPQPENNQPFSITTEYSDNPWNKNHKLLKIGLQGKNIPQNLLPASNLVFLIDVSGSMSDANKLPLLKSSFKVLLDKLRPQDKVALVTYAGNAGVVLEPTSAAEKSKILTALENLEAGGSTAGGAGIELAYKLAQENFVKNGNNRVILATDGDFNVGVSNNSDLQTMIEEKRKSGIFLTCLGFGMGNYKDNRLEMLSNKGNGNYAYIDNIQEANKFLGKEFAGSMYTLAKDVKIQIEFNPNYVSSYRLIGYENRKLRNEDFTDDKIDAGELGVGHTVTALYEIIPKDVKSEFLPNSMELKYSQNSEKNNDNDEIATIKFRYKKPDGNNSIELKKEVKYTATSLNNASPDFKFASSVAWLGLVLRKSQFIQNKNLDDIIALAKQGKSKDEDGYRSEFIRIVESYITLSDK